MLFTVSQYGHSSLYRAIQNEGGNRKLICSPDFIPKNHNVSKDMANATGWAITAGTDNICEVQGEAYGTTDAAGAHSQSLLAESTIDKALARLYEGLVRTGYFDADDAPYRELDWKNVNTDAAQALAVQSAVDGIVMKKNDGSLLPINLKGKRVAVIGHWASATYAMLGGYSGIPPYYHNPVYAAKQLGLDVYSATGPTSQSPSRDTWTESAVAAAQKADVVVYCGGNDGRMESEDLDRYDITWPQSQLNLISKLAALGKPMIVAEMGDQNDDTPLLQNKNISAILWAGFPGQSGGTAVFDVITGKTAPAGRLPVTMYPGNYVNEVSLLNMNLRPGPGNPGRTYRWYNKEVLPFGYGLHYTTFNASFSSSSKFANKTYAIADLMKSCKEVYPDLCAFPSTFDITVKNSGNTTSDFVALAFLSGNYGPAPHPLKSLAAYTRLRGIKAGEAKEVKLSMTLGTLARTDANGNLVLYPGKYEALLDVPTLSKMSFTLTGDEVVLDKFPQPGTSQRPAGF